MKAPELAHLKSHEELNLDKVIKYDYNFYWGCPIHVDIFDWILILTRAHQGQKVHIMKLFQIRKAESKQTRPFLLADEKT